LKSVPRIADREAASCWTIGNPLHFSSPSGGKGADDDIPSPLDRFPETIQVSWSIGRNGEEVKRARSCEAIESARKKHPSCSKWRLLRSTPSDDSSARRSFFAQITNTMGQDGTDFEKGDAEGTTDALAVLEGIVAGLIGTYGFHWERGPLAKFMALCWAATQSRFRHA
jgi:hypothetical protein